MNMKGLYRLDIDFGRSGDLSGVFIADTEDVEILLTDNIIVYFGEVLGKHSEVTCEMKEEHIDLITTDENVIKIIEEYGLENGINPFDYFDMDEYKKRI